MRKNSRTLALAGLLAGALILTACGGGDDPTVATGGSKSTTAEAQFNQADVTFVSGMVPHHSQAVEMADMILAKDPSAPVRALAEKIKGAQQPEIEQMNGMLEAFGEQPSEAGHTDGSMTMEQHAGMMSGQQMQELRDASGVAAERLFLTLMLEHHKGAVEASRTEIAEGEYAEALDLAAEIRDGQTVEIAQMQQLLSQL